MTPSPIKQEADSEFQGLQVHFDSQPASSSTSSREDTYPKSKKARLMDAVADEVIKPVKWDKRMKLTITKDFRQEKNRMLFVKDERPAQRIYTCDVCEQSFMQADDCIDHMKTHIKTKSHKCDVYSCNMSFTREEELFDHKAHDHGDPSAYYCKECNATFPKSASLKRHMKAHLDLEARKNMSGDNPFTCQVCHLSFSQASCLAVHKRTHTGEKPHHCPTCDSCFSDLGTLKRHQRTHSNERPYVCQDCGKAFKLPNHLVEHRRLHTGERPFVCEFCGAGFAQSNGLKSHRKQHAIDRPNQCQVCSKAFSAPKFLEMHMRVHRGEKPFTCEICDRKFRTACNLGAHRKLKHDNSGRSGEKIFTCDECGATFSQACNLGIHKKKKHSNDGPPPGEKNFVCNICDARFSEACNLGAHKKIKHTAQSEVGQTVFECNLCGAKFYRECNLAGHKRRKHNDDGSHGNIPAPTQLQHTCSLCNARFTSTEKLEEHQNKTHFAAPVACHICTTVLPDVPALMKHLESHTADRFLQEYDMLSAQN